jgi:hypothetical protein
MRAKVDRLETFVNALRDPGASSKSFPTNVFNNEESKESLENLTGKLRLSGTGGTQYIGPSHWESIIEDIGDVKAYFDIEDNPESLEEDDQGWYRSSSVTPADIPFRITRAYSKQEIIQNLPSKGAMDQYVASWFNGIDPIRRLTHGPSFQKEYQDFWRNPADVSEAWLALLLAIAGLGAEMCGQGRENIAMLAQAEDFRRYTTHALVLANITILQAHIIEALMLHVKSILLKHHDVTSEVYLLMGLVTRSSTQAGYHRDPKHNPAITPFQAEIRRRVWCFISEYDVLLCYQRGCASVINQQVNDTAPPANLFDSDISPAGVPPSRPLTDLTPMTTSICYNRLTIIVGDVVSSSQASTLPSDAEIAVLHKKLEQARNELPPRLHFLSLGDAVVDPPELALDRYRLEILHVKAICILYRRYLGMDGHQKEQQRCLKAAEDLIQLETTLLEACLPGARFAAYPAMIRRHVHDLNLASVILCYDLRASRSQAVTEETVERSRRIVPLLYRACILWENVGVTSPKARQGVRAIAQFCRRQMEGHTGAADTAVSFDSSIMSLGQVPPYRSGIPGPVMSGPADMATIDKVSEVLPDHMGQPLPAEMPYGSFEGAGGFVAITDQDSLFRDVFGVGNAGQDFLEMDWR